VSDSYPYSEIEQRILKRSQQAMRYALLCSTGIGAPLFCVLTFRAAAEAIQLINQERTLETLLPRLFAARLVAGIITASWGLLACAFLILFFLIQTSA
jgi:hypothetical protein